MYELDKRCKVKGCSQWSRRDDLCMKHYILKPKVKNKQRHLYPHHKLYYTNSWKKLRETKLAMNPLCEQCGASSLSAGMETSLHIDHINDHKGDENLFYELDNLQTLCISCHSKKSMEAIIMRNLKKDSSRVVNIFIDPENSNITKLRESLGYENETPEFIDTVIKSNGNDKFVVESMKQAEIIARRYQLVNKVTPKFNKIIKGKNGC